MQTKQLHGILLSVVFVLAITLGYNYLLGVLPSTWLHPLPPPYDLPLLLLPVALITFFVARKINLNAAWFGVITLMATFFVFAGVYEMRGYYRSFDVPLYVASFWTVAFLTGFLGEELRQQSTQRESRSRSAD